MKNKKTILISPLDWGIGHASRIIPIIGLLIEQNHNVLIAANNLQKKLLQEKFPQIEFLDIVPYNIKLSKEKSQNTIILSQIPAIIKAIKKEKKQLNRIIAKHNIDIVISDNRYGLYNKKIKSIFITHQTHILLPKKIKFLEPFLNRINTHLINKFDICWVPDYKNENNFSGILSHKNKSIKNLRYIGVLSKFEKKNNIEINNDILVILSGPEPQRTIFENIIETRLGDTNHTVIIVRGNNQPKKSKYGNIDYLGFANSEKLNELIHKSQYVISRSGYSSIMDYIKLQKQAIIVPTPGQTEQEYLANYLFKKQLFVKGNQDNFNFRNLLIQLHDLKQIEIYNNILHEIFNDINH